MWITKYTLFAAALLFCGTAEGRDLPLGETIEDETTSDSPTEYDFQSDGSGVLTIVVRGDGDISISVLDESGQPVPSGRIDIDFEGNQGAEQGAIILGEEGKFRVVIGCLGFEASYVLGASWLPIDEVVRLADPQGSPGDAVAMELEETYRGAIEIGNGDRKDWFRFEAEEATRLTVATRSRENGDLVLESYSEDSFEFIVDRSDQDLEGNPGNESITTDLEEGDIVYFVVSTFGGDAEYAIRAATAED